MPETTTLKVTGMTCNHCVAAVKKALERVPGVEEAQVSLDAGEALVSGDADRQALIDAVKSEGYSAE
jgi:copper chaperone